MMREGSKERAREKKRTALHITADEGVSNLATVLPHDQSCSHRATGGFLTFTHSSQTWKKKNNNMTWVKKKKKTAGAIKLHEAIFYINTEPSECLLREISANCLSWPQSQSTLALVKILGSFS